MFWQAALDTRKFSFESYGKTENSARKALLYALKRHGEQYELESDWYQDFTQDIVYRRIVIGQAYRDRSPL